MKKPISFVSLIIIIIVLIFYRFQYSDFKGKAESKVTTWDALGYYFYLPATFIYRDVKDLSWFDPIDKKYQLSGGVIYQYQMCKNGNPVFKYLGGVAIIEAPFFFIGHTIAKNFGFEADGFSAPYQYSIALGILFYFCLALFLLRRVLLKYYSDQTTAITLLLLVLATNSINYTAVEPAQSHGPIFVLYVILLYATIKWHERPKWLWAAIAGYVIGLATISRPTEAIMFLIPLLWNTENKEASVKKWDMVGQNRAHIYIAITFGFLGILPQLIYWKYVTGSFIYDVGSAWDFLTPHLRVLIGWEKGWFIYTPITLFFIAGMFFMRKYPFKNAVLYFCLLNIYIIISWRIWRYGGSYSTRALMQSYPVFALAFGAFIDRISITKWKVVFYLLGAYLIFVNLFQIKQYYNTILHYDDMNRRYYGQIYLNSHPKPLDMSLLDTKDWIRNEDRYNKEVLFENDTIINVESKQNHPQIIVNQNLKNYFVAEKRNWLKVELSLKAKSALNGSYIHADIQSADSTLSTIIRLANPISKSGQLNSYAFYMKVPDYFREGDLLLSIQAKKDFKASINSIKISTLTKK